LSWRLAKVPSNRDIFAGIGVLLVLRAPVRE
jgi:hypothetical protein